MVVALDYRLALRVARVTDYYGRLLVDASACCTPHEVALGWACMARHARPGLSHGSSSVVAVQPLSAGPPP